MHVKTFHWLLNCYWQQQDKMVWGPLQLWWQNICTALHNMDCSETVLWPWGKRISWCVSWWCVTAPYAVTHSAVENCHFLDAHRAVLGLWYDCFYHKICKWKITHFPPKNLLVGSSSGVAEHGHLREVKRSSSRTSTWMVGPSWVPSS